MATEINNEAVAAKIGAWKVATLGKVGAALRRNIRTSLKTGVRMTVNNAPTLEMAHAMHIRAQIDKALGNPRQRSVWVPSRPGEAPRVSGPDSLLREIVFKVASDGNSVKVGPIGTRDVVPNTLEKGGQTRQLLPPSPYAAVGVDKVQTEGETLLGRIVGEYNGALKFLQITPELPRSGRKRQFLRFIEIARAKVAPARWFRRSITIKPRPFLAPALEKLSRQKGFDEILKNTKVL